MCTGIREEGLYSGVHIIYENEDEFRTNISNSTVKLHKWAIDDFRNYQVGDYIIAEDGNLVRILAIREMKSKKPR